MGCFCNADTEMSSGSSLTFAKVAGVNDAYVKVSRVEKKYMVSPYLWFTMVEGDILT